MWNRTELKARGKEAFKRNYWMCVLAGVLLMITTGGIGSFSYNMGLNFDMEDASAGFPSTEITNFIDQFISSKLIITVFSVTIIVALIVSLALSVLVFGPLEVGCCNFFKKNAYEKVGFEHVSVGFKKETYKNIDKK